MKQNRDLDTYIIGGATSPTYLMFADGILCFAKADIKSMTAIAWVMQNFPSSSNFQVNASKSSSSPNYVTVDNNYWQKSDLMKVHSF